MDSDAQERAADCLAATALTFGLVDELQRLALDESIALDACVSIKTKEIINRWMLTALETARSRERACYQQRKVSPN